MKGNLVRRQKRETLRRGGAQPLGGAEAIDQYGLAAFGVGFEAVQELQSRDRIAVGIIGVGADRAAGEGEVVGGGLGDDIEDAPVVSFADEAEQFGGSRHLAGPHRHPAQEREAEGADQRKPAAQRGRARRDRRVIGLRQARAQLAPPEDGRIPGRRRRRAAMGAQPRRVDAAAMALGREGQR